MDFYIGGYGQGKLRASIAGYKGEYSTLDENSFDETCLVSDKPIIINHIHLIIKKLLEKGMSKEDIFSFIERICKYDRLIIISDEIGNGIVPLTREDRAYRDIVGECQQIIAKNANNVYRVYCGICQQIK